jgi:hypothetical protein
MGETFGQIITTVIRGEVEYAGRSERRPPRAIKGQNRDFSLWGLAQDPSLAYEVD